MGRRVYIDAEECIGCGSCEEICPEVFNLKEETDKGKVIKAERDPEDLIEEAMETCSVSFIHWEAYRPVGPLRYPGPFFS